MEFLGQNRVRIGEFVLDLRAGELRKENSKILLQEQPFQILLMLVERRGELVDREEIRKRLWPNDTIVEFDHSIHTAIKKLRQALEDSADSPRFVETVARRGYRLIVPVELCAEPLPSPNANVLAEAEETNKPALAEAELGLGAALIGKKISHYRVLGVLGGGGMGLIYWAEDIKLGRSVALKFLPEELATDSVALERFEREARAMSALDHPNICAVHEFGEHGGRHFIVMPLLEGKTLRDRIGSAKEKNPPFSTQELVTLALQIADGLAAAHRQGIIHRDIKPSNIFVTNQGVVKILDFGLAKQTNVSDPSVETKRIFPLGTPFENALPNPTLTRAGAALGTAAYMSPEQVRGEPLDARSDLFSFGLVLHEMATGHQAFEGPSVAVVNEAILNCSAIPVRQLSPEVPLEIEKIINKALEKDRQARFQSATEVSAALKNLVQDVKPRSRLMLWMGTAAGMVILVAVATAFWLARRQPQAVSDLKLTQLTFNSSENPVRGGAISPDGKYLAYNDKKTVYIKRIGSDDALSIPQPEELQNRNIAWEILAQGWFPDNARFLANAHPRSEDLGEWSSKTTSIWAFSVAGGAPHKVRDNAVAFSVSPDSSLISFGQSPNKFGDLSWEREIWVMSPSGENAHKLYDTEGKSGLWGLDIVTSGHLVSYTITDESGDTIVSRDLRGGSATKLFEPTETKKMGNLAWLPGGRIIYADACDSIKMRPDSPCNLRIARINTDSGELMEKPKPLTNWVGAGMNITTATRDGRRVAFLRYFHRVTAYIADLEGGGTHLSNARLLTSEEGGEDTFVDWTLDRKAIIFNSNRADHTTFQKQSLDTGARETIATLAGLEESAYPSPDGRWLIAQLWLADDQPLHLVRIPIGGGTPELILTLAEFSSSACVKPPSNLCAVAEQTLDHKQTVITSFDPIKGRGSELARFDLSEQYQAKRMEIIWDISSDGTKLAFVPGHQGPIYIRSLQTGQQQIIPANGLSDIMWLAWTHSGRGFFVRSDRDDGNQILHVNLNGDTKMLWNCGNDTCNGAESPDGRRFALNIGKFNSNLWMIENF